MNSGTGRDGPNTNTACAILVITIPSSLTSSLPNFGVILALFLPS